MSKFVYGFMRPKRRSDLGSMEGLAIETTEGKESNAHSATRAKDKSGGLEINPKLVTGRSSGIPSAFSPHNSAERDYTSSDSPAAGMPINRPIPGPGAATSGHPSAPERHLTLVALRLAVLEKAATGLGVMAFVWATVVLLGGFVSMLQTFDFWVVSVLLLTEGTRVFSRSHELEWQHIASRSTSIGERLTQAGSQIYQRSTSALRFIRSLLDRFKIHKRPVHSITQSNSDKSNEESAQHVLQSIVSVEKGKDRAGMRLTFTLDFKRTWSWDAVPFVPFFDRFVSSQACRFLILLQLASALVSVGLSFERLIKQNYGDSAEPAKNVTYALNIFYALMLAEALIFLLEKAYLELKISFTKVMVKVSRETLLGDKHIGIVRDFFYDVYACCLKGSVFDGLDMDLVGYSIQKIQSDSGKEQLAGIRVLATFSKARNIFGSDTLRRIGTSPGVIDRLLEMLTWKNEHEQEIRRFAAEIMRELVRYSGNRSRVVAATGALDCLLTLLIEDEIEESLTDDNSLELQLLKTASLQLCGLEILNELAKIHRNREQIGSIPGMIPLLVNFSDVRRIVFEQSQNSEDLNSLRAKLLERSLQLLKLLSSTPGTSGFNLRDRIKKTVSILPSLRDVLSKCNSYPTLQGYTVDIITSLALDEQTLESIGCTGQMISLLFSLFLIPSSDLKESSEPKLNLKAGQALNLLVFGNGNNCRRLLRAKVANLAQNVDETGKNFALHKLIQLSGLQSHVGECAASILQKMFEHLDQQQKSQVAASFTIVMKRALDCGEALGKSEGALGLAASIISFIDQPSYESLFSTQYDKMSLVRRFIELVVKILDDRNLARIRRHIVELAVNLMRKDAIMRKMLRERDFESHLENMLDTMSDAQNYATFSGARGLTRHAQPMEDLIELALAELQK